MYSPILVVHICAGMIGVLSGFAALFTRKGARLHRRTGDVFVVSMLIMAASGAYVAQMHSQRFNVIASVFAFYLVASGWWTVAPKNNGAGRVELGLLLYALAAAVMALLFAWQTARRGLAVGYCIFAAMLLLSAAGDIRLLVRGRISGAQRLARHLWRMCFALFIAASSFFLGTSGDPVLRQSGLRARLFTKEIRATHLPEVPVILIVVLMLFWLGRVLFTNVYRKPRLPVLPK